jgi:predicted small lipoprotein YifL
MKRATMALGMLALAVVFALGGCGKGGPPKARAAAPGHEAAGPAAPVGKMDLCDFKAGPENAAVKVVAFYPGRHEDTLAAVKALLQKFPDQVSVQIVDWRTQEGVATRDQAGLSCAGITINGKNAMDLTIDGKTEKVMFIRGMNGDWTEAQLLAAVQAEVAASAKAKP